MKGPDQDGPRGGPRGDDNVASLFARFVPGFHSDNISDLFGERILLSIRQLLLSLQ